MELKSSLHSTAERLGRVDCAATLFDVDCDSSAILINRGWVPSARMEADTRKEGQVDHMTSGDTLWQCNLDYRRSHYYRNSEDFREG